jgi:tetratricopeptide (TPR) repeat protein
VVTLFKELGDSGAKLLTDFPKSGEIVGKSYYALAMYEEAASVYETMLEGIDDPNPKIYLEYATTCSSLGDYERAKKVLEESDSLFAGDYANLMQAQLSSMQGNYLDAETKYLEVIHSHVIDFDMLPEAYIGLAETYLDSYINYYAADESQRIEDALKKCTSLIEQAEANRKLGNLKRLNEIRNFVLDHSDDSNPGYTGSETEGDSGRTSEKDFMNAFNSYAAVSQYGKALEVLDEYIREYQTDYYPHAVKALLLAQLQNDKEEPDYSEAMKQYEQTMSLLPHERPQDEILDRLEEMASWLRENGYAE